jgi:acetyltransferase-like isoleucine patch superfamily enzyme
MRSAAKTLAHVVATVLVSPALLSFAVRRLVLGQDRALEGSTEALAVIPGLTGEYLRRAFLAWAIAHCDRSATIRFGTVLSRAGARLDANVYVGPHCHLGWVHLERDVLLGAGVHVPSGGHLHGTDDPDRPIRDQPGTPNPVRVGEGTWIGSAAVILADVGQHCVIGAGSVVTRPIEDFAVAAGVPARVIRDRRRDRHAG